MIDVKCPRDKDKTMTVRFCDSYGHFKTDKTLKCWIWYKLFLQYPYDHHIFYFICPIQCNDCWKMFILMYIPFHCTGRDIWKKIPFFCCSSREKGKIFWMNGHWGIQVDTIGPMCMILMKNRSPQDFRLGWSVCKKPSKKSSIGMRKFHAPEEGHGIFFWVQLIIHTHNNPKGLQEEVHVNME